MRLTNRPRKLTRAAKWAIAVSCFCHALLLGLFVGAIVYWHSHLLVRSGSAAGAPTLSLQKMVVVADPEPPEPPAPPVPLMPDLPSPTPEIKTSAQEATSIARLTDPGVPVLPGRPGIEAKKEQHETVVHSVSHPSAAPAASSFAPGENILPHPPYPPEARTHGQTGTVVVNVLFDSAGNVSRVSIAEPSGVKSLDTETCSYIQGHWHSAMYAGQAIKQPVEYSLQ